MVPRRVVAALLLNALFLAIALGGRSFVYCRAMREVMTTSSACACASAHVAALGQTAFEANPDCLEQRSVDKLLSFTPAASLVVHAASLLATLPAVPPSAARLPEAARRPENPIRAGPHGPASVRARLMVFLT